MTFIPHLLKQFGNCLKTAMTYLKGVALLLLAIVSGIIILSQCLVQIIYNSNKTY